MNGKILERVATAFVALAALTLFLYHAASLSLWYDEIFSLGLASSSWSAFWRLHQANMVLYDMLLLGWVHLTGWLGLQPSALLARLPSIAAMALVGVVIFKLGSRFWSLGAGLVASLLFLLNGLVLQQAQQARSYALYTLLVCLAWGALLQALKEPGQRRWWALFALASILALYSQLMEVFVLTSQVLGVGLLLWTSTRQRALDLPALAGGWKVVARPFAVALASVAATAVPLALDATTRRGSIAWVPAASPARLWAFVLAQTGGPAQGYPGAGGPDHWGLGGFALLAGAALGTAVGLRRRRGVPLLLLTGATLPVLVPYVLSQPAFNLHLFYPKYLLAAVPPLVLLVAVGVTTLRPLLLAAAMSLALLAPQLPVPGAFYRQPDIQPFRQTTTWMELRYEPGDGIICRVAQGVAARGCGLPVAYYLKYVNPHNWRLPDTFPGSTGPPNWLHPSTNDAVLRRYLRGRRHVFVFTVAHVEGDPVSVKDNVPGILAAAGYLVVATYRLAPKGYLGDMEVQEYALSPPVVAPPIPTFPFVQGVRRMNAMSSSRLHPASHVLEAGVRGPPPTYPYPQDRTGTTL